MCLPDFFLFVSKHNMQHRNKTTIRRHFWTMCGKFGVRWKRFFFSISLSSSPSCNKGDINENLQGRQQKSVPGNCSPPKPTLQFHFFIFFLVIVWPRLMYDVSTEPLGQNSNIEIWTVAMCFQSGHSLHPQRLVFQFHSTAKLDDSLPFSNWPGCGQRCGFCFVSHIFMNWW